MNDDSARDHEHEFADLEKKMRSLTDLDFTDDREAAIDECMELLKHCAKVDRGKSMDLLEVYAFQGHIVDTLSTLFKGASALEPARRGGIRKFITTQTAKYDITTKYTDL